MYSVDPKIMKIKRPWRMPLFLLFHLMTHRMDLTIILSKEQSGNSDKRHETNWNNISKPTKKSSCHVFDVLKDHLIALPLPNPNTPTLWQLFSDLLPILALHAGHQVITIARMHIFHTSVDLAVGCRKGNWNYTKKWWIDMNCPYWIQVQ